MHMAMKRGKRWTVHPTTLPHTMLPAPLMSRPHPSALLYSQRKSPFPEAIILSTRRSWLNVTYRLRQGQALQCVFLQQLRVTHIAGKGEVLLSGVWNCGRKSPCFHCLPFDWKRSSFVFSTARLNHLTSLFELPCAPWSATLTLTGPTENATYCPVH